MGADKTSNKFDKSLLILSSIGFLIIILNSFFNINFLGKYQNYIGLVLIGAGLLFEVGILHLIKTSRNGISEYEFFKWITAIIGVFILIIGLLSFLFSGDKLVALQGVASVVALGMLLVEGFLVK